MTKLLEECKLGINSISGGKLKILRSDLYAKGIIRDILLVMNYVPFGSLVLDLGCGFGYISATLAKIGYSCIGVDLTVARAPFFKQSLRPLYWQFFQRWNANYLYFDGENLPLGSEKVDAVILYAVLEHVSDDFVVNLMTDINRVLKKEGHIFIFRTPRKDAISERVMRLMRNYVGESYVAHETLLSEEDVVRTLKKHFKIKLIDRTDTLPQHFPKLFQNIWNFLTPVLYQVQCIADHSVLSLLAHHTRVVAVKE